MTNNSISISKVYALLNKILNTLVKKKYGSHYSIRLNALCFMSNRTTMSLKNEFAEKITLKSQKPISLNELNLIKDFLLFNLNSALMCIDTDSYIEVVDIKLVII
jgi:hypothetical protein